MAASRATAPAPDAWATASTHVLVPDDVDEPDQGNARRRGRRHPFERGQVVGHERRFQQEVFGGVAGDGELRKGGHVGALGLDVLQAFDDPLGVSVHLAHGRVELAQRHTQVGHGEILPAPRAHPAWHAAVMAAPSPGEHRAGATPSRPGAVPKALADLAERSASPEAASATLHRMVDEHPDVVQRLVTATEPSPLASLLIRVSAASNSLGRLCVVDPAALDVLDSLDRPFPIDSSDPAALARSKRLELLRIAARDLLGLDTLETVGTALADLAQQVLGGAVALADREQGIAVIGMGKLGGRELNYASDVDILFVTGDGPHEDGARHILQVARQCFRVDADLRPEGRAGPLTRSLDSYNAYWARWAATWEFQALLKARAVAGDAELGHRFERAAVEQVWGTELQRGRAGRGAIDEGPDRGARHRPRPGGSRDQTWSGRDPRHRVRRPAPAAGARRSRHGDPGPLDAGRAHRARRCGYVADEDAGALAEAYRFLRTVEHRLQLVEEDQTHSVPTNPTARRRLALVLGFEDDVSASATARFDDALRRCQRDVRTIHERLFFRPLLEAFATVASPARATEQSPASKEVEPGRSVMSAEAVARRLAAFGFSDATRTRAAIEDLAGGLTRSSRLMAQLLPLLLDWLSLSPDPDLGLLGLRNLAVHRASALAARLHLPGVPRGRPPAVPVARVQPDARRGHRAQSRAHHHHRRRRGAHSHAP